MASQTKYTRLTTSEENVTTFSKKSLILVKLFVLFLAILMCFGMFIEVRKRKDIQNYAWKLEENLRQHIVQNSQKPIRQNSPIEFYEKKSEPNHVPNVHKPEFPPYISPELQSEPPVKYGQNDFFTQRESGKELKAAFFLNDQ